MEKFEFHSGPDTMIAELRHYSPDAVSVRKSEPYISFHGTGPRGGYCAGPTINEEYMDKLDDLIAEAKGWPFRCKGCGRAEDDCSADPCPDVIADREENLVDEDTDGSEINDALAPDLTDEEKADQKHNAQMLDGCETEDEVNAELRHQSQGS